MSHAEAFRAHVTSLARAHLDDAAAFDAGALRAASGRAARGVLGARWRADTLAAAGHAAVYLRLLRPSQPWAYAADGQLDERSLLWMGEDGYIADLLVTATRRKALWTPRTSGEPRALLREGRERHGKAMLGVRVLALASPASSLLIDEPTAAPKPLPETALWLASAPLSARRLAELTEAGPMSAETIGMSVITEEPLGDVSGHELLRRGVVAELADIREQYGCVPGWQLDQIAERSASPAAPCSAGSGTPMPTTLPGRQSPPPVPRR